MPTYSTDSPSRLKCQLAELDAIWPNTGVLNEDQQTLIDAYRSGQIDDEAFQLHLANDPVLANYVEELCQAGDDAPRDHMAAP
ncbi:hypothetical protein AS026_26525 [Rhizobium altiplani]|uniref:Antitoxin VbhA domain-containing protein n=1 Tax=Rhizobium altiplani TaxID=1864509 RepID=A0A109J0S3_9HYPH|nr:hypothetical protein [Rhizobium altiplani]KWV40224.1 hypothetical protein AS026_26525 [Rhizobium altiplani]